MEQTISGVHVEIDRTLCIGSGNCVNVAPEVFEIDDENLVRFASDDAEDIDRDRLVEACNLCPVDALIATEDGEQIVP